MALTRFLSSGIWEVKADAPVTFAGFTFVLVAIAAFACLVATRRGADRSDSSAAFRAGPLIPGNNYTARNASTAFRPPNANELDSAYSTCTLRA